MTGLLEYLKTRVPLAQLQTTRLPQVPEIQLQLLAPDYPHDQLSDEQALALMDAPLYWSFCWASGQVLARFILDHPEAVAGQTVVDFGAGSGVVGIAAALAGARRVFVVDEDPIALEACRINAQLNQVDIESYLSLEVLDELGPEHLSAAIICVADVFYDRDNIPLLERFNQQFKQVLIGDSRLGGKALAGVEVIDSVASSTVPDLDESREFNSVTVYRTA